MTDSSEQELVAKARAGDRAAFSALVRTYQRRIHSCALHVLGDRAEAEDAVQETFLRAFRALPRFDGRSTLHTWLYRICVNVSLNALRRRRRAPVLSPDDPRLPEATASSAQPTVHETAESREFYAGLAEALDALTPSLRATVTLVCIEGLSQRDAAQVLGCSEGTIAWRVFEARRRMRLALVSKALLPSAAPPDAGRSTMEIDPDAESAEDVDEPVVELRQGRRG